MSTPVGGSGRGGRSAPSRMPGAAPGPDAPVYVISVAAELTGLHPQTLRSYDRLGLVQPGRTGGGGRRYSWQDIELLREVAHLTAAGIGLEGVRRILELEHDAAVLRARVRELEDQLDAAAAALQAAARTAGGSGAAYAGGAAGGRNLPVRATVAPDGTIAVWRRRRP